MHPKWWAMTKRLDVMTLDEVAAYLRVNVSTVYRLLKADGIPAWKVGSDWRFDRASIEAWQAKGGTPGGRA